MTRVWLAQLKCSAHHCICAIAHELDDDDLDTQVAMGLSLREAFDEMVRRGDMTPNCGICHSTTLYLDVAPTKYGTMAEAKGPLMEGQADQWAIRQFLHRSRN